MNLDERNKLIEDNLNLVHYVIHKFIKLNPPFEYEDLFQVGSEGLIDAADKFNNSGNFSTFAVRVIKTKLLSYCRDTLAKKRNPDQIPISLENPILSEHGFTYLKDMIPSKFSVEDEVCIKIAFEKAYQDLNDRQKDIIKYISNQSMHITQADCAKHFKVSRNTVSIAVNKFIQLISKYSN